MPQGGSGKQGHLELPATLPADYWARGAALLHQQCWNWGRDIHHAEGNLLCRAGFVRTRPPEQERASSRYLKSGHNQPSICLWGFGLYVGQPAVGGIYLNRYEFRPRWVPDYAAVRQTHTPEGLARFPAPLTKRQLRQTKGYLRFLLHWLASYEEQVLTEHGLPYRLACLAEWKKPGVPPSQLPGLWRQLAWQIPEPPQTLPSHTSPAPAANRQNLAEPAYAAARNLVVPREMTEEAP